MDKLLARLAVVLFGLSGLCTIAGSAESLDASDWVIPKICADAANRPVPGDPYAGCPKGAHLRSLMAGDDLPYRRLDQTGESYKDIYPRQAADGREVIVLPTDSLDPKNAGAAFFKVWDDGYDLYMIRDGWFSGSETRMGSGEYGTTFMGAGCRNYNGLVFFPARFANARSMSGEVRQPGAMAPWEENGESWPGACPTKYVSDQLTSWVHYPSLTFGGIAGVPTRSLEAIVTTIGPRQSPDPKIMATWMAYGHLEVFYFTRLYGLARWESWVPQTQFEQFEKGGREPAPQVQQRAASASTRCAPLGEQRSAAFTPIGASASATKITMTYQRLALVMNDCRDWTRIVVAAPAQPPPAWPVSALNLLHNFHFNADSVETLAAWHLSGAGHASLQRSATKDDTTKDTQTPLRGVSYLRFDCTRGCNGESIFQDLPVAPSMPARATYVLGAIARSEAGRGRLEVELTQLGAGHAVLSKTAFTADLAAQEMRCDKNGEHCLTFGFNPEEGTGSVLLASNFVNRSFAVTLVPGARILRFSLTPRSDTATDVVSAWLMRAP